MKAIMAASAGVLFSASVVCAQTLQMDLNALGFQVQDAGGVNSPFGGLTHTGSVNLTDVTGISSLAAIFIDNINQGFNGNLTDMVGSIQLSNGQVVGGNLFIEVNGTDTYTAQIAAVGSVQTFIGGGYTIQGLTFNGVFSSNAFGNVNVAPWNTGSLPGSFLQFNFDPDANGAGFADMDLFVNVIPLPPAVFGGLAMLGGLMAVGLIRRRK
jgi:hypothetical protein